MMRRILLIIILFLSGIAVAQESTEPPARGIIYLPVSSDNSQPVVLNPLFCSTETCDIVSRLLFPTLLGINPVDQSLQFASVDNYALVASTEETEDGNLLYTLREDALWSDGSPISTYDIFFSYLNIISDQNNSDFEADVSNEIQAMIPLDETSLLVIPIDRDCDVPAYTNFPVIPYHVFDESFANRVQDHFDGEKSVKQFEAWIETDDYNYGTVRRSAYSYEPDTTYGPYVLDTQSAFDYIRLVNATGQQVIETSTASRGQSGIDTLIRGDIAYYQDPPRDDWNDLRNNPDINAITTQSNIWYYIALNFTDPAEPLDYLDDEGEVLEQNPHPILSNPDVRLAIQLGINVQELIDIVLYGEGEILPSYQLPASWAYNPELEPVGYDPELASQLLEEAGWRRTNPFGNRICIDCETTFDDRPLILRLMYDSGSSFGIASATLIARQLANIGVGVELQSGSLDEARQQTFDMYIGGWRMFYPNTPDIAWILSPEEDEVGQGYNIGSYNNPDIMALNDEANHVASCDITQRRELYHEMERLMQEDQPYIWLFTPYEMTLYHSSIQHVVPQPARPLDNIDEWSVWRMP